MPPIGSSREPGRRARHWVQMVKHRERKVTRQQRRYSLANLSVLPYESACERVIVRKGLQQRCLPNGDVAMLLWVQKATAGRRAALRSDGDGRDVPPQAAIDVCEPRGCAGVHTYVT